MPDKDLNSWTAADLDANFSPQFLDYIRERQYQNAKKEEQIQYAIAQKQNRVEYRRVTYRYNVRDKITVYDDERLEFGYIVKPLLSFLNPIR